MSRHKLVKALDLEDELVDFDGGIESDHDEEVSAEEKEQLRSGTIKVRNVLGNDLSITDKEIEDSLWHYYYDIEKTVNYLLSQKTTTEPKKSKKKKKAESEEEKQNVAGLYFQDARSGMPMGTRKPLYCCSGGFSAVDFFKDSPWLSVPEGRLGEILIEPLHPRGRLLGGASKPEGAPKSKLALLVAARKKKENKRAEDGQHATSSVALLDKLGGWSGGAKATLESPLSGQVSRTAVAQQAGNVQARKYPVRKLSDPASPAGQFVGPFYPIFEAIPGASIEERPGVIPAAAPSTFARTIFGFSADAREPGSESSDHWALRGCEPHTEFNFAGPSPDDVVLKAQSSSVSAQKPVKPSPQPAKDSKTFDEVAQGVKHATIEEPKVKGKNLDVLAEFERSKPKDAANFVVIGHVDAGKSTLMGRLLHDLNVVDKRTVDKYRKEAERLGKPSFALAWVLDQGTEERERGVTIDIAMNRFETDSTNFTILDAPGHRDFIPNMIAGASQADFAVLVIDASIGNFESGLRGQTKEHALLVRSMGIQRIVTAVNKLDIIDWSQDRFEEIKQQVSSFLTSAGFLPKNLAFVPCAGITGENIVRKPDDPKASWYTGPPLVTLLESSEPMARALERPLRLTIDDIFRGGVQNPLSISGRVDAGNIQFGEEILIVPANQTATVRGLEVDAEAAEWAVAGQNVILHLTDIEAKYLKSGDVVCAPTAPISCITSFIVKILAFEHVTPMHCEIHKGRLHAPGRVTKLVAQLDRSSGAAVKGKPRLIKPGSVAKVVVEVDEPIPLEPGGRVIIRAGGETLGAGLVE